MAHASEEMLWVANVLAAPEVKPAGEKTVIRYRALNTADQAWHDLPTLAGRAVQMANRGQSAVVLMKSGDWLSLWPDGSSTGPSLPNKARMVALASERDRNALYAIGIPGPKVAGESSESATTAPAPSSQPTVDISKPVLFSFEGTSWQALANCPEAALANSDDISLAVIDRMPMIAQEEPGGSVHVYQLSEERKWIDRSSVKPPENALNFRLLSGTQRPMLWIGEKNSGGLLYFGGEKWLEPPTRLSLSRPMSGINGSLVSAAGALRLFLTDDKAKLFEQRFDSTGNKNGELAALPAPQPVLPQAYESWPMLVILAAMGFMMLSSARRQTAERAGGTRSDELLLASSGQRLSAGLIDAVPIILSVMYLIGNNHPLQDPADPSWLWPVAIAMLVYLLHTTLSELLAGRTVGKIVVGLQVVAQDGKPAGAGAIIVRNLLRVIDIFPVPLALLILTSPMKQRLGDILGGTIVIIAPRAQPDAADENDSESQDE